ncbi:ATP-dependent DNA ligase [Paenibacillus sp. V4I7]|nr:ATP-dependent DNA ligase [Paenibacillus sp. V4I7]
MTGLPLEVRKGFLEEVVKENDHFRIVRPINGSATDFFNIVCQHGLEGIVIKKKNSKYEKDTRSWSWQKVINYQKAEVYITGYSKKEHSWLLGYSDDGRIRPIGALELGISQSARQSMWPVFQAYKSGESKDHVFVQPLVRCKVKYRDWYKSGAMRLPVFEEFIV